MPLTCVCKVIRRIFAFGARVRHVFPVGTSGTPRHSKLAKVTKRKFKEMQYWRRGTDLRRFVFLRTILRKTRSSTATAERDKEKAATTESSDSRGLAKEKRKQSRQAAQKRAAEFKFILPDRAKESGKGTFKKFPSLLALARKLGRYCRRGSIHY
ncbi:uncharacterized protein LOC119444085 [Dermacentor silvarum]|uniref:uncharacterized protein LOC119444085 n=1 Tax=Dermacentor silvarum TaxID=543639 RepID=UPI001896A6DD|nr:uncharacterized protein LOC119444085 [Dermacentor silvarum]